MENWKNNQFDENDPVWKDFESMQQSEEEIKTEKLDQRFNQRFNAKQPYLIRYAKARIHADWQSYVLNAVSIATLWYAVVVLLEIIPIPYANYVISTLVLGLFEWLKRKYSDLFWDFFWAKGKEINIKYALINFGILFGISLFGSSFGVYFGMKDNAPEARFVGESNDPEAQAILDRIEQDQAKLDSLVNDPSSYNSQGKFYWNLMPSRTALDQRIAKNTDILETKYGIFKVVNEDRLADWKTRLWYRIGFGLFITILAEILFERIMSFRSNYDYKKYLYLKFKKKRHQEALATSNGHIKEKKSPVLS